EGKKVFKKDLGSYWGITSGQTSLAQARFGFVTTLLRENDYWSRGLRNHGNAPWNINNRGGWCGEFPRWAASKYLKIHSESPSNDYRRGGQFLPGSSLGQLAAGQPIAGTWAWWANNKNYHKF